MPPQPEPMRGRGAASNPANRFELIHYERDSTALPSRAGTRRLSRTGTTWQRISMPRGGVAE